MKITNSHLIGGTIIAIALGMTISVFQSTLTPYVTIAEAKEQGRVVQVAGLSVKGSHKYDFQANHFVFRLREDGGAEMVVEFNGAKPVNLDDATKVVAIGRYLKKREAFEANELLVKCPTKYEGRVKGE